MNADINLQVWLDTQNHARPEVYIPYVQSEHHVDLKYLVRAIINNNGNSSRMSQGGSLHVPAGIPVPLPKLAVSSFEGECLIEVVLTPARGADKRYQFDCSLTEPKQHSSSGKYALHAH